MISYLLMMSLSTFAFVGQTVIEGKVRSFNNKEVDIASEKIMVTVPRKLISELRLKPDQKLKVELSQEQFKSVKIAPINK